MTNSAPYKILGWLAMTLTPIGAVIFFGWRVYEAVILMTETESLAIAAGLSAAIGLEMVGIFAGHIAMELWRRGDQRAWLAALIMVIYVTIGAVELKDTIGQVMFFIAPLVYILVGLRHSVDEQIDQETAAAAFDLEQAAADREVERQLKLQRQADNAAAKLAKIQQTATSRRQDTRQDTGILPSDWRQLTAAQRHDLAHLSRDERENAMPDIAARTRRVWHERLDKIAAQNGSYLQ